MCESSSVCLDSAITLENHVPVSRLRDYWGCLLVVVALLILYTQLPLGTALEFSSDEGYEVMKPFLYNQGHILYTEIWDDQPPVFTILIATAFKSLGTTILSARLVTATFGLILFIVFHELVRRRSSQWSALLATFLLLSSPGPLPLSVSVMQEVPAMATGLLAAWLFISVGKVATLGVAVGFGRSHGRGDANQAYGCAFGARDAAGIRLVAMGRETQIIPNESSSLEYFAVGRRFHDCFFINLPYMGERQSGTVMEITHRRTIRSWA